MCTLAVHWGWLDTVPGFPDRLRENPPRHGFFEHPEYLAVRAHLPAPWQEASLFFRLLVRRYERASLIVTSNKSGARSNRSSSMRHRCCERRRLPDDPGRPE